MIFLRYMDTHKVGYVSYTNKSSVFVKLLLFINFHGPIGKIQKGQKFQTQEINKVINYQVQSRPEI